MIPCLSALLQEPKQLSQKDSLEWAKKRGVILMEVSFDRNGADLLDGAMIRFESAEDFSGFCMQSIAWDDRCGCLKFAGTGGVGVIETPEAAVRSGFDQLVVSWSAQTPDAGCLTFYARARIDGQWTKWYTMGIWNRGGWPQARTSVNGQDDDHGAVDCDVLKLKAHADALKVRVEFSAADDKGYPCLRFLAVNVTDSSIGRVDIAPVKEVWGTEIDVPYLCQISEPDAKGWCSPTSTSMLLCHWANELNRPELATKITPTARAVYDESFGGTGNWIFNTAHASEHPGIRGYVTRFVSVSQIERWIAKGFPVIVSLKSSKLRRDDASSDPGHLMVIRGFTSEGDPIFNDPWPRGGKREDCPKDFPIEDLRKVFPRKDLEYAWLGPENSCGAVYLIFPEAMNPVG